MTDKEILEQGRDHRLQSTLTIADERNISLFDAAVHVDTVLSGLNNTSKEK